MSNIFFPSPLRYPGGKSVLAPYIVEVIERNGLLDGTYIEPFAGGAGIAWNLLLRGHARRVIINDACQHVAAFWRSLFFQTDGLIEMVDSTKVNINNYMFQKEVANDPNAYSDLELGFATLFLNRTNRSGILSAGPIGGYNQKGNYKIDARFNKANILQKIRGLSFYSTQVSIFQKDAITFIEENVIGALDPAKSFIYFDPPYYIKGRRLYFDAFKKDDHTILSKRLAKLRDYYWILSYDSSDEIRRLYSKKTFRFSNLDIGYSANSYQRGQEVIISPKHLSIPEYSDIKVA